MVSDAALGFVSGFAQTYTDLRRPYLQAEANRKARINNNIAQLDLIVPQEGFESDEARSKAITQLGSTISSTDVNTLGRVSAFSSTSPFVIKNNRINLTATAFGGSGLTDKQKDLNAAILVVNEFKKSQADTNYEPKFTPNQYLRAKSLLLGKGSTLLSVNQTLAVNSSLLKINLDKTVTVNTDNKKIIELAKQKNKDKNALLVSDVYNSDIFKSIQIDHMINASSNLSSYRNIEKKAKETEVENQKLIGNSSLGTTNIYGGDIPTITDTVSLSKLQQDILSEQLNTDQLKVIINSIATARRSPKGPQFIDYNNVDTMVTTIVKRLEDANVNINDAMLKAIRERYEKALKDFNEG